MAGFTRTLLSSVALCAGLVSALTSTLQTGTLPSGQNPTNVGFYYYKPTTVAAKPAVIVAVHECTASGTVYFQSTPYAGLADTYGFIVIYPSSPHSGTCWDVSSKATLTHNGGGDSNAIANMATYAINTWNADASRIFVTGTSSGAMMTNLLAATYPEIWAAASVYSGVAAGCFVSSTGGVDAWNSTCAEGQTVDTPQQWANVVHAMYPGYTGPYVPIQEYHGTADTTLYPPNLNEELKQWCGVFGYNYNAPTQVLQNTPNSGYTKTIYGPAVQGILAQGVGHTVPIQPTQDMMWFGFVAGGAAPAKSGGGGSTTSSVGSTTSVSSSSSIISTTTTTSVVAPPTGCQSAEYGQCGGIGWTGCNGCVSGTTCQVLNSYYSQCLA
ncbi:acetyl xylan esterase [Roridomyces roridus]|uniref:Carboxylic ester hydrolase n=1 Tax=Roridomyces roridus TaxID=1738132 RepID=A0AAD7FEJ0_9AGAR|nr:acetyl xylan esterase [Roridomyces roridus]